MPTGIIRIFQIRTWLFRTNTYAFVVLAECKNKSGSPARKKFIQYDWDFFYYTVESVPRVVPSICQDTVWLSQLWNTIHTMLSNITTKSVYAPRCYLFLRFQATALAPITQFSQTANCDNISPGRTARPCSDVGDGIFGRFVSIVSPCRDASSPTRYECSPDKSRLSSHAARSAVVTRRLWLNNHNNEDKQRKKWLKSARGKLGSLGHNSVKRGVSFTADS